MDRVCLCAVAGHDGMARIDPCEDAAIDIDHIGIALPAQLLRDLFTAVADRTINCDWFVYVDTSQPIQQKILVADPGGPRDMTHFEFSR